MANFFIKTLKLLSRLIKTARWFSAALIPLCLMCFLFIKLGQGQDILIILLQDQEKNPAYILTGLFFTGLWSAALWYPARLIAYIDDRFKLNETTRNLAPRLVGFLSVVVIHCAIFTSPYYINPRGSNFHVSASMVTCIVLIYLAFQILLFLIANSPKRLNRIADTRTSSALRQLWYFPLLSWIPWCIPLMLGNGDRVPFYTQGILFCSLLIILQWVIWVLQLKRRLLMQKWNSRTPKFIERFIQWQIKHQLLPDKVKEDSFAYALFLLFGSALIVINALAWTSPKFAMSSGPYFVTLLGLSLVSALFCLNKAIFALRLNSGFFIYAILIFAVLLFYPKGSTNLELKHSKVKDMRPTMREMLRERLLYITQNDTSKMHDVYIVLSDGGASRSGWWAATVLDGLNQKTNGRFLNNLLIMSSTSGGSVGNGYYYHQLALRAQQGMPFDNTCFESSQNFFKGDFLSHPISTILIPDLFMFSNLYGYDRGHALIESMNHHARSHNDNIEAHDEASFQLNYCMTKELPMLFLNTTSMKTGKPGVIANVRLDSNQTFRTDVLKIPNSENAYSLPLSASLVMSSRFPFISPGGVLGDEMYVDGGYFDNSGAGIVLDVLRDGMNDPVIKELLLKHNLKIIHIKNDEGKYSDSGSYQSIHAETNVARAMNNYLSPAQTVLQTYSSQTGESDYRLLQWCEDNLNKKEDTSFYCIYNLYNDLTIKDDRIMKGECILGYPMSWVISDYNIDRMKEAWNIYR